MQLETTRNLPVPLNDAEVADRVREAKDKTDEITDLTARIGKLAEDSKSAKADV